VVQLTIDCGPIVAGARLGDSISINGTDLTVTTMAGSTLRFEMVQETASLTSLGQLRPGSRVNLERALRADGRYDGHIVQGHVDGTGAIQDFLAGQARRLGLWIIGGTLPIRTADPDRVTNSSLVFDPAGQRVARYDKIHLFRFEQGAERYDESRTLHAGATTVTVDAPCGKIGLSICYDLRFPELYRAAGVVDAWFVPSAFTALTGAAHWDILMRARAIENQCYLIAPAQGGLHPNGRRTWGHSMVVDPWGEVLACRAEGEGVVLAELDAAAAKAAFDAQQKVYDSRKELFDQGAIPRRDLDSAEVAMIQARSQNEQAQKQLADLQRLGQEQALKAASGQLSAAKGTYENAQAQLSYSVIHSPIDGVVTDRPLYQGELATANQPILTVMNTSKLIAKAHVPQSEAVLLKVGDHAELNVQGVEEPIPGRVMLVSPALDPGSTTIEIWVEALRTNPRGHHGRE
jgi:nitrilase